MNSVRNRAMVLAIVLRDAMNAIAKNAVVDRPPGMTRVLTANYRRGIETIETVAEELEGAADSDVVILPTVPCEYCKVEIWIDRTHGFQVREANGDLHTCRPVAKGPTDTELFDWWFRNGLVEDITDQQATVWWADSEAELERVTVGTDIRDAIAKAMRGLYDDDDPAPRIDAARSLPSPGFPPAASAEEQAALLAEIEAVEVDPTDDPEESVRQWLS